MKTQTIHARVSPKIKKASENILKKVGLTMSEAIGLFLHQVVNRKEFPLELRVPNAETIKALKDVSERRNLTSYSSVDELFEKLSSDGKKYRNRKKVRKGLPSNGKARHENAQVARHYRTTQKRKATSGFMPSPQT